MISIITILMALFFIMGGIIVIVAPDGGEYGLFKAILIPIITAVMCYYTIILSQPDKPKMQSLPQVLQTLHNTTKMCVKENLNLIKTKQDINSYNFNNCKIAISDNILSCKCKTKASIPNNIIHAQSICSDQNNTIKCNTEYQITHKQNNSSPDILTNVIIIVSEIFAIIVLGLIILHIILDYEEKEKIVLLVSTAISIIGSIFTIAYFILTKYHHVL